MDLGLVGRVVLVTGASKGLGLGVARALAQEGARVAVSSRSPERIEAAAASIGGSGFVHDAADVEGVPGLLGQVESSLGSIDVLVCNSGGPPATLDVFRFDTEQWRSAYEMLLLGQLALIEAVLPGMRERGWGRVVSLSSSVVREPDPVLMLSASHRAALLGALKTLARRLGPDGVTVNTLMPGIIDTDRVREIGLHRRETIETIPMQRLGTVDEFGAAAAFLCSEPASYITGTTLVVDGGAMRSV